MTEPKLKPCPFCDSSVYFISGSDRDGLYATVTCDKCNVTLQRFSTKSIEQVEQEVTEAWNIRVTCDDEFRMERTTNNKHIGIPLENLKRIKAAMKDNDEIDQCDSCGKWLEDCWCFYKSQQEKEETPMSKKVPLSQRIRPNSEAAPWVIEEVKQLEAERDALVEKFIKTIDDEPELTDEMPDMLWEMMNDNKPLVMGVMRAVVKVTKDNIKERIRDALLEKGNE